MFEFSMPGRGAPEPGPPEGVPARAGYSMIGGSEMISRFNPPG